MKVKIGKRELEMGGKYLTELRDSNDILGDTKALLERIEQDGYLLIRGFHDREQVLAARRGYLKQLHLKGHLLQDTNWEDGVVGPTGKGASFMGNNLDMPALLDVVNSPKTMQFFDRFLGGKPLTFDFKWARAVGPGEFTGSHYDIVYMGRGTKKLYTLWTPLGDIAYDMGGLAFCLGSQHFERIKQTYGQMDVDRDNVVGWFSDDPIDIVDRFGGQWGTTTFEAGDVLIFGMYIMHASLTNTTDRLRLSVDTRYQLASEPADERWCGREPKGHYAWGKGEPIHMEDARSKWGV